MLTMSVVVCALALTLRGDSNDALAGSPDSNSSRQVEVQPQDRPGGRHSSSISANEEALDERTRAARVRPVPLDAEPQGDEVLVSVGVGSCGDDPPELSNIVLIERTNRVIVTAYVSYPPPSTGSCFESEHVLFERVTLAAPIGDRSIYDGVRWPPILVWSQS